MGKGQEDTLEISTGNISHAFLSCFYLQWDNSEPYHILNFLYSLLYFILYLVKLLIYKKVIIIVITYLFAPKCSV